jgi:hypothetical protein
MSLYSDRMMRPAAKSPPPQPVEHVEEDRKPDLPDKPEAEPQEKR